MFFLGQAAGRNVTGQERGKIIDLASTLCFQGGIRVPNCAASKAGVAGLTRLLANEWTAEGVDGNAVAVGGGWLAR